MSQAQLLKSKKKKVTNILALIKGEKINIPKNQRTLCTLKNQDFQSGLGL